MQRLLVFTLLLTSILASGTFAATKTDPSGEWKVTRTWLVGTQDEKKDNLILILKWDGTKLTGQATWAEVAETEKAPIFDAQFKDGTLSFRTRRGGMTTAWTGTLSDDALKGGVAVFLVTGTWEAKRVEPSSQPTK